jgi:hypothetical protein
MAPSHSTRHKKSVNHELTAQKKNTSGTANKTYVKKNSSNRSVSLWCFCRVSLSQSQ